MSKQHSVHVTLLINVGPYFVRLAHQTWQLLSRCSYVHFTYAMFYSAAARTPRKGLAAELANESERLKHGISEGLPQVATRACRKKEAEEKQAPVRSSGNPGGSIESLLHRGTSPRVHEKHRSISAMETHAGGMSTVPALPSLPTQGAHSIHLVKGLTAQPGVRLATATSLQPGDSRYVNTCTEALAFSPTWDFFVLSHSVFSLYVSQACDGVAPWSAQNSTSGQQERGGFWRSTQPGPGRRPSGPVKGIPWPQVADWCQGQGWEEVGWEICRQGQGREEGEETSRSHGWCGVSAVCQEETGDGQPGQVREGLGYPQWKGHPQILWSQCW